MRPRSSRVNPDDNSFPPERNYMVLTIRDLLEAREHYHLHLAHLPHVVGTALGRYLIHEKDWYAENLPTTRRGRPKPRQPRTLFNTVVTPWSWPCILVFLDRWEHRERFAKDPDRMVPRALYLPDGRVVPTCTVLVEEADEPSAPRDGLSFANSLIGGGYVTFADVQGRQHLGSLGCLVTDGDLTYALTNRHVTGTPGRELFTTFSGKSRRIGVSDANQLTLKPFKEMYSGWPGEHVQLHLDAGLIRVDDVRDWTTQVAGIGPMGEWLDLTPDTLTLELIDDRVRAFGAASGELRGRIAALFYRYSTAGGTDYVTDFLIRPESLDAPGTLPGDSGTVWFWEQRKKTGGNETDEVLALRPFAAQWGGHTWVDGGLGRRVGRFALATALSTICRELDVRLVRDWNTGLPEYWGPVGHYTIGYFACEKLSSNLGRLMKANQTVVSYPLDSLSSRTRIDEKGAGGLVPLADVPDRLWAHGKTIRGGADKPSHFADMDQPDPQNGNRTLLELCADPGNVDVDVWLKYYEHVGDTGRGCLPFRVWQFFDEMRDAADKGDATRYVCAAGILAHYVGDACQPLHLSYLHDGEPQGPGRPVRGKGVHAAYEETMLRQHSVELLAQMKIELGKKGATVKAPSSGRAAAVETVRLMRRTFTHIKPIDIVNAFDRKEDLWEAFHARTVIVMADGVRTLRAIWRGAWKAGNGDAKVAKAKLAEVPPEDLIRLYMRNTWMPSKSLKKIGPLLKS